MIEFAFDSETFRVLRF